MIDLFETIIKMHTVVIMGEYFKRNELSEMAKGMLAYGLQTPSLGTWQKFSRDLCGELVSNNHVFVLNYFQDEFLLFDKTNNDKTNIISFRNRYAHGATPTDEDCEADILQFEHFLLKLLDSKWFKDSQLIIIDNTVFIQSKTTLEKLNLHPILVCKEEPNGQPFTFFNDIKDEKVGLLNYPLSKHYREQKTYIEEFYAVLPLKEWKQNVSNEFKQYVEELTEGFKGRIMELKAITTFIETKEKGYLSIQGNPGIGKSTLIAQISRELNKSEYKKKYKLCEYFIRRGTRSDNNLNLLSYLLKTTDVYYPEGKSILPEGNNHWELQQALFAKWTAFGNGNSKFKLLFLIDGLDEGVENDILNYLPRENFKNILFIYGSRHGGHLKLASFWTELPIENHETILLGGLNKEDIRAFLYEVVNKYEIEQAWIDEILNRSEGNPLYLKLLCNALENGSIEINNNKALPKEIDSYYKAILNRYAQQADGDALIECLLLFAVALDYLTPAHLGIMNSMSVASQQRAMSVLTEVLYENPLTDLVLDYQLFHESFREYVIKTYPFEIKKANQKIIDSCQKWHSLDTLFEQQYVLEYFATHLIKSGLAEHKEVLVGLGKNEAFQKTQKQVLRNYNANFSLLRAAMTAASELEKKDEAIEIGLRLVDLQNEENNDVQSIIDMVANNEMELATLRIKNFGGSDKEDKQRQFILLMLCLMELTLIGSKEKIHKKEGIEALLQIMLDEIPVDHSFINWGDFFPSYLAFLISVEIKKIDLDYTELYKRTNYWEAEWIKENGPYTDDQIEIIIKAFEGMDEGMDSELSQVAIFLAKQGELEKAIKTSEEINVLEKSSVYCNIAVFLANQGKILESDKLLLKAIQTADSINDGWKKSKAYCEIAIALSNQGKILESDKLLLKAIQTTEGINDDWEKSKAYRATAAAFANQGNTKKAIQTADSINDDEDKSKAYCEIAIALTNQGKIEESDRLLLKAIQTANRINNKSDLEKSSLYCEIAVELASQGKLAESDRLLLKAIQIAGGINVWEKCSAYCAISVAMVNQGKIEESDRLLLKAIQTADYINDGGEKSHAYRAIALTMANQGKISESCKLLLKAIKTTDGINDWGKSSVYCAIAVGFSKQGNIEKAIQTVGGINDDWEKSITYCKIAIALTNQGKLAESDKLLLIAIQTADGINNVWEKSITRHAIAVAFANQGNTEKAIQILDGINDIREKSSAYYAVAVALANHGNIGKAIQTAESINDDWEKVSAYCAIAAVLAKLGELIESDWLILKATQIAESKNDDWKKSKAYCEIAVALVTQGELEKAIQTANRLYDDVKKSKAFYEIAITLAKQGELEKAIQTTEGLYDGGKKSSEYRDLAIAFANQNELEKAIYLIQKINRGSARMQAYQDIGKIFYEKNQLQNIQQTLTQLPNDEAVIFYKKGMANAIIATNANASNVLELLALVKDDKKSTAHLLQMHALYLCFFEKTNSVIMQRFNKTLNIQWALDIASNFEKEFARASHNVQEWINEIEDENDREDILGWTEKVEQGKMTEEKFLERIGKL
jgi:hypothetical protein